MQLCVVWRLRGMKWVAGTFREFDDVHYFFAAACSAFADHIISSPRLEHEITKSFRSLFLKK
jgi:hypothetical protein